jgi:hypothetical protein
MSKIQPVLSEFDKMDIPPRLAKYLDVLEQRVSDLEQDVESLSFALHWQDPQLYTKFFKNMRNSI